MYDPRSALGKEAPSGFIVILWIDMRGKTR